MLTVVRNVIVNKENINRFQQSLCCSVEVIVGREVEEKRGGREESLERKLTAVVKALHYSAATIKA